MFILHSPPLPRRVKKHSQWKVTESPSLEEILEDICTCFDVPVEMIKSKSRLDIYVIPRRLYCYVAHVLTNKTCYKISKIINRDHSTYVDRVDQCFEWFKLNEAGFMEAWYAYTLESQVWRKYYQIKLIATKAAACGECLVED